MIDITELYLIVLLKFINYLKRSRLNAEAFHQLGKEVLEVIRDYDRRLCAAMGRKCL